MDEAMLAATKETLIRLKETLVTDLRTCRRQESREEEHREQESRQENAASGSTMREVA
jgi:hypothetical protein